MTKHIVIDARIRPSSTGRYVDRLLEHLQEIDSANRYTVLLEPGDSWRPSAENFSILPCKYKKFSFNPLDQITFARYLKKLKPDLVHFAMTPQEPAFYNGVRVTTTHDLTMLRFTRPGRLPLPLHWLRMTGYRWLFRSSHKKSRVIITPSEYVKNDLVNLHPFTADKTIVTYEASEPPIKASPEKITEVQAPFILHVGSPFPHKNIVRLIEAFTLLKESEYPDLQLVLAGKKEYYFSQLKQGLKQYKFKKDVIMPGFVSEAQLKWLYENAECYVLPSLSEGFGLPGLEAMVHGVPVASSNATCLPEVYGDAATYFNPSDPKQMAMVIDEIISNKSYADKMRTLGKKRIELFSWRKMAEQTLAIYDQL